MYSSETLNLSKLVVNQDNPRFPEPQENQRAAINTMLRLQQDKLIQLATDICERGLDPTERVLVVPSIEYEGRFKVLEGNRRITALKILHENGLIDDEKTKAVISRLAKTAQSLPQTIECAVLEDEADSEHWVSLKHTGQNSGKGRVEWQTTEKERFKASLGKESYTNQFYTYLMSEDMFEDMRADIKRLVKPTNIGRLLGDPHVRKCLNLEPINGFLFCKISKEQFFDKCYVLVNEMLGNGAIENFRVQNIFYKEDRSGLMSKLRINEFFTGLRDKPWKISEPQKYQEETPNSQTQGSETQQSGSEKSRNANQESTSTTTDTTKPDNKETGSRKHRPENSDRNKLISQYFTLKIESQKCNEIFKELKTKLVPIEPYKYSISVMIRIFLDLSVSYFIEHRVPKAKRVKCQGLHEKIVFVSNYLRDNDELAPSQATAVQTFSSSVTGRTGDLQQYVHNESFQPEKSKLIAEWDNFSPLFRAIWK